jgi:hypothetical protein
MRISVVVLLVGVIAGVGGFTNALAAADECLSRDQLHDATRMAAVMGIGAAVRRCGHCLGADQYAQTLEQYDAAGLMRDFSAAQVTLAGAEPRSAEYGDTIVRQHARTYAETLSNNCDACRKTADLVKSLSSAEAREKFYEHEGAGLASSSDVKLCP